MTRSGLSRVTPIHSSRRRGIPHIRLLPRILYPRPHLRTRVLLGCILILPPFKILQCIHLIIGLEVANTKLFFFFFSCHSYGDPIGHYVHHLTHYSLGRIHIHSSYILDNLQCRAIFVLHPHLHFASAVTYTHHSHITSLIFMLHNSVHGVLAHGTSDNFKCIIP